MEQNIENKDSVEKQIIIAENHAPVYMTKPSRWAGRFERLKKEIETDTRFDKFIDDLEHFNTVLDGRSMSDKLADGGFNQQEILDAIKLNERYWKKSLESRFYQTAQIIDVEIFSLLKINFQTYVIPLIEENGNKAQIRKQVMEQVIGPIAKILNDEGYDDVLLNYNVSDLLGMLYFLTGKCHINWQNYDTGIQ